MTDEGDAAASTRDNKDNFSVTLKMDLFRPSEMSVKLVDGSVLVVEAKHGDRPDESCGSIARHFLHRYRLPSDIDPGTLASNLSDKGILTVTAKKEGRFCRAQHTDPERVVMSVSELLLDEYEHPDPAIFYAVTRTPGRGCADVEEFADGCECEDSLCTVENGCPCLKSGRNYARSNGSVLLLELDKFGDVPVFECRSRCACFDSVRKKRIRGTGCPNRCVQFGPVEGLEVFGTPDKGLGLKSGRAIPAGSFICEYAGEVIGEEEARRRLEATDAAGAANYIFVLTECFRGSDTVVTRVDPTRVGNIARYINHSCRPNAAVVPVRVDDTLPLLCIFAKRDIAPGEEISFDYAGSAPDGGRGRKPCLCRSENCRKWLPHHITNRT